MKKEDRSTTRPASGFIAHCSFTIVNSRFPSARAGECEGNGSARRGFAAQLAARCCNLPAARLVTNAKVAGMGQRAGKGLLLVKPYRRDDCGSTSEGPTLWHEACITNTQNYTTPSGCFPRPTLTPR